MKDIRDKSIPVRVSEKELEIIKEKADKLGLQISTYLRFKALQDG